MTASPKRPLKIGVLIDRMNVGGVEKIAIEEVIALRKAGQDAQLVVLCEKAVVKDAFSDLTKDIPIVYLDKRLPRLLRLSFAFPVFSFFSLFHLTYPIFLPFVVKKREFDYFIVHGTYTCFSAITLQKFRDIHYSGFIWDPVSYILERVYKGKFLAPLMWLLKKIAGLVDRILINSMDNVLVGGSAHNSFIHRINPDKPIETVYPSVHPAKKPLAKKDYVLMVTAWKDGKNPEYIFDIVKKLPDIRIKMVGKWVDPDYRQRFEQAVKKQEYNKQIEIVGGVSEAALANYYAHARVLLQTNDDRGFGMPAMEAAGYGTTFIIPRGQGVCSLFKDGEDGFYTKERDTAAITGLLEQFMYDKQAATRVGEKAWRTVVNNYSWQKHAKSLILLINKTLENHGRLVP